MSSKIGKDITVEIYGGSHEREIGVIINGLPKGERVDKEKLTAFLTKRKGLAELSTPRREEDSPCFESGLLNDVLTGETLKAVIYNKDFKPKSYSQTTDCPRPSHADYVASEKYRGAMNMSGGGHFSGRMTAPLCIAGGIVKQILERQGVVIGAHIYSIKDVFDTPFSLTEVSENDLKALNDKTFAVIDEAKGELMKERIVSAKQEGDSVGGIIEVAITGLPVGVGEPMFDGLENNIAKAVFGVPAVKGIEFGNGFNASGLKGSENNDAFYFDGDKVKTKTNNSGGINGGISNGMPIVFRVAIKPTPTIFKEQETVNLKTKENVKISYQGRHDPCVVPRAIPGIESAVAIAVFDLIKGR